MITRLTILVLGLALILGSLGCQKEAPASLYDPNYVSGPQPKITSLNPPALGLAGVTSITIAGQNFSTVPANNLVIFDAVQATVLQASATQLVVRAPNLISDTIKVKVGVFRSDLFSNSVSYKLVAAAPDFGNFKASEVPYAVECDSAGNIYVSLTESGLGSGVKKYTPAGVRTDYSPPFSTSVGVWRGMKFGPGRAIYSVASRNIIFQIPAGGGASSPWLIGGGLSNLSDLDFDQNGNIWTGGPGATSVFRVKQDKSVQGFPFTGTVRAVRVYNNYLYVGGKRDSLEKVWRFPIGSTGDLGPEEEYFNLSTLYGANSFGVTAITFSSDGDMYVGTDGPDGIVLVHPGKTSEPLYPGIIKPVSSAFAWGKGADLFVSRTGTTAAQTLVDVNTQKASAPYYGRTLP